jgi:hypothetical protein
VRWQRLFTALRPLPRSAERSPSRGRRLEFGVVKDNRAASSETREDARESGGGWRASSSVFCVFCVFCVLGALRIQEATSGWCTERKAKSLDFKFKQRTRNYSPFEDASQRRCFRRVSVSKIKEGQVDGSSSLAVPAQAPPGPTAECRMQTADCRG